jgi:hypothetical protein
MSLAMLRTANAILDRIGVPGGMGSEYNIKSANNLFDDELRLKYLDAIKKIQPLEPSNIELRKFTIFDVSGTPICLARILSINRNPNGCFIQ